MLSIIIVDCFVISYHPPQEDLVQCPNTSVAKFQSWNQP